MDKKKVKEALEIVDNALENDSFNKWIVDNQDEIDEAFDEEQMNSAQVFEDTNAYDICALRLYLHKNHSNK